jgi:hypothetical protein
MRWTRTSWFAAALLCACDGVAGSDYNGQPLAVLKGTVSNQSGIPPAQPIDAALLWRARAGGMAGEIMSATPVTIVKMFPAQFTISIYLPAPAAAFDSSTLPYAVANVGAITHGATPGEIQSGAGVLGRLADPLLYYLRRDLPPGLMQQQYGALKQGYHLVSRTQVVDPATLSPSQVDACATVLTGEAHDIAFADAQLECAQSLLSQSSHEVPLSTPVLLQVVNP